MGSVRVFEGDWIRRNQGRYLADDTPETAMDAVQHVLAARAALEVGEYQVADIMYTRAKRLWRQMESKDPGHWGMELIETASEMRRAHHGHH